MAAPRLIPEPLTRRVSIIAQDPSVRVAGEILMVETDIPREVLAAGPRGYRVFVIDYDASTGKLYQPSTLIENRRNLETRGKLNEGALLDNPAFHAHNVYCIVMRTLARFEFALGRRVGWSFKGHQIHVAPHAFADANAFYSEPDWGLFFGYYTGEDGKRVYTCLSHDIVAHETTHALLDGLRSRYTEPSSLDQAAFHEGFADIVALLSVFSLPKVVEAGLTRKQTSPIPEGHPNELKETFKDTILFGLGEQLAAVGDKETIDERREALRRSVRLKPNPGILETEEFREAHRRGEVLVAAVMKAFLDIWVERISHLGTVKGKGLDRARVAEEGRIAADHLLTMASRALDYAPPTDIRFGDFLSALLTADYEVQTDDTKHRYRQHLLECFRAYGIKPTSPRKNTGLLTFDEGIWEPPGNSSSGLDYSATVFESMQRDRDEVFKFLWNNRVALGIFDQAYTAVESVRPCTRISSDGFTLRETVVEYVQILNVKPGDLAALPWGEPRGPGRRKKPAKFRVPEGLPDTEFRLYGGGALIFGDRGQLKYHVRNKILNAKRQQERLECLLEEGALGDEFFKSRRFADLHRQRLMGGIRRSRKGNDHAQFF